YLTTIPLLDELLKKGIDGTGTIMANRVRNVRFRSDSEMKQRDLDELTRKDEKVANVKWKDSRTVLLASTCAGATNVDPVKWWSKQKYVHRCARTGSRQALQPEHGGSVTTVIN
ncbi:hypothetical protein MTO96_042365, partial [Rhipicephalus appendiculatus]